MSKTDGLQWLGNIYYGKRCGYNYAGNVFDRRGVAPTITCSGGGTDSQWLQTCEKRSNKIVVVGSVWNSRQNGLVLDPKGVSPTISVGAHSGVEPKIRLVYETD